MSDTRAYANAAARRERHGYVPVALPRGRWLTRTDVVPTHTVGARVVPIARKKRESPLGMPYRFGANAVKRARRKHRAEAKRRKAWSVGRAIARGLRALA